MLTTFKKCQLDIVCRKNSGQEIIYTRQFDNEKMISFFENIASYLKSANVFYKNNKNDTTTVAMVEVSNKKFVVKRYNFRSILHRIKLQFRRSHAYRSFFYAFLLSQHGIPTIKPVAVIQNKMACFKRESYFISEFEEGCPGCVYFKEGSSYQTEWPKTADLILETLQKMQRYFIAHGDFHFGNFLIVDQLPLLLDFDRIQKVTNKKKFKRLHLKDIQNFQRYLTRHPSAQELFKHFSR